MQSVPSPHPSPFRPLRGRGEGGVGGAKRWMTFQTVNTLVSMFYEKAYYQVCNFLFKSRKPLSI